ncbi:MAG TPA: hypothetical protein PK639_00820 [Candidatus Woesebacteria bacterium]|nr:hypothetical protein [Candidatus Woesebacteria bacterium]
MAKARECFFSFTHQDDSGKFLGEGQGQLILIERAGEEEYLKKLGYSTLVVRYMPVSGFNKFENKLVAAFYADEDGIIPFETRDFADKVVQDVARHASLPQSR